MNCCNLGKEKSSRLGVFSNSVVDLAVIVITIVTDVVEKDFGSTLKEPTQSEDYT